MGQRAAVAAFLIIQHADLAKKKYLPVIKKRCEEKEADWGSYALMYDRVQVSENRPQRYGSQLRYNEVKDRYDPAPIENERTVEELRKEIGMVPLADYLLHWNIRWEHKSK